MALNVGVIGTGMIGTDHIRRLTEVLAGAAVVAVNDSDAGRARSVAAGLPGATVHPTGEALIADARVDAVVIASWGPTHEPYLLAAIAAGKPVFCEKPLATTEAACRRVMAAEVAVGRRLVQVGFMRRYDAPYLALREAVAGGAIGTPLILHSVHRNPSLPPHFDQDALINDTMVHDVDIARWLLADEVAEIRVFPARPNRSAGKLREPLLAVLRMRQGALVDVEVSGNIGFGYDIRGEVVGETGTAALAETNLMVVKRDGGFRGRVPADWRERFARAYDDELRAWIAAAAAGTAAGPSTWDGLAATVVTDAGVAALASGEPVPVALPAKPGLYG
jgi:myo-inositol 2-dehydrogenase / D-chiro-inositol 1-dehydrogenase